jgi:ribose transport system substrate-binding protein
VIRLLAATVTVIAAALSLAACGEKESVPAQAPKAEGKPTVCLIMKSLANDFFQQMQKGAEAHVAQRGDVELEASGIQNETDVDGQLALVDRCITEQVQAIVIAPADSKALVQSVARAMRAGIKVVNIDVRLDQGALAKAGIEVPYVGPDNREGAKQSGMVLAKELGSRGKVVILEGNPGADNAAQRKQGFMDAVKEGGLDLVASKTAHWETDEANAVFSNLLTANPDIDGVMASNDSMALGVLKVIQERHADIKVASFDNIPAIQPYLKRGEVVATLDQFGSQQAADGIDFALKMLAGARVTGWQKTNIKLIAGDAG